MGFRNRPHRTLVVVTLGSAATPQPRGNERGMSSERRFTGRQITTMVVAVSTAVVLAPASAIAVGEFVKITDNDGGVANVAAGELQVGDGAGPMTVDGTVRARDAAGPLTVDGTVNGPANRVLAYGNCVDGGGIDERTIAAESDARVTGIVLGGATGADNDPLGWLEVYSDEAGPATGSTLLFALRSSFSPYGHYTDDDADFGDGLVIPGRDWRFKCGGHDLTWMVYGRTG